MMECGGCAAVNSGPSISTCGGSTLILFMGLLEQFLRNQCDIEDPCGRIASKLKAEREYDFIVVGGGSAGSVVANRLSEVPSWKVLLVEAGGNEPTGSQVPSMIPWFIKSDIDWQYLTEPEEKACLANKEQRCYWPRGKVIGGTSVLNGMMYMRGSRRDYDNWEMLGNTGWSYDKVLPYFKKSENNLQVEEMDAGYHGTGGYLPVTQFPFRPPMAKDVLKAAKELGHRVGDLNGQYHAGFAIAQTTSKNGIRHSTARSFLRPVQKRPNLHILLNTTVARVLVNPKNKQAYGVEIISPEGKKEILAKKEVVVSGGSVNSPQLLLLSGIGPKEDLESVRVPIVHNLQGVGKNLHNHVAYALPFYVNETATTDLNWAVATQYLLYRDGLMASTGMSQVTGMIKSKFANQSDDHPDIQFFFGGYSASCAKTGEVGELNGKLMNGVKPRRKLTITPVCLHPKSRGYLTLKDNDPLSSPKIFAKYLTHPNDVATIIEGIKFVLGKFIKTKALEKYGLEFDQTIVKGCEEHRAGSDAYWECAIRRNTVPEHHQAGSCKMGPASDPLAVVDPELRVHGVDSLRVIDNSIMPAVTSGNTNVPAIMIAEKGSEMIKKKWSNEIPLQVSV